MKKIYLLMLILGFGSNGFGQLKNQVILLDVTYFDKNDPDKILIEVIKSTEILSLQTNKSILSSAVPLNAITNIAVNTISTIIKNRINRKTVTYTTSVSGDNFYFLENDSIVNQGLKSINLKRIYKSKKEFDLQIISIFSNDKRFFKWRIAKCEIQNGAFKKKSKTNIDLKLTIDFNFQYILSDKASFVNLSPQLINVYAAQKYDSSRLIESNWMEIPKLSIIDGKLYSPVFEFKIKSEEVTSLPEIYKEILKEEDALKKSLTEFIKTLNNSTKAKDSN